MTGQTEYTLKEVATCDGRNGARTWIVINDLVYDVTDYKQKHPGGAELLDEYAGQDATSAFEDFGHSSDAKRILKGFLIGELVEGDKRGSKKSTKKSANKTANKSTKTRRRIFLSALCGSCVA